MSRLPFRADDSSSVEFLQAEWLKISGRIDAAPCIVQGDQAGAFERDLEDCEEIEAALFLRRARSEEETAFKLRVLARSVQGGAEADHVLRLLNRLRGDLARFPLASTIR